ncbi:DUF6344 domain-containing protein [Streptomyces antibioticus]|uniref:DUF6344 domain-containing protein n=1 Tax=Streptomyces antibioticus TaxID=1890 RepID=UPI003D734DF5
MTANRVMKLWTTIVTAFLALFAALGIVTTTAPAAAAQTGPTRTDGESATGAAVAPTANWPALVPWERLNTRSLPPTMKQRIRAEAHGKSPSCRNRPLVDTESESCSPDASEDQAEPSDPATPLKR